MKRVIFSALMIVLLASAAFAACRVGGFGWQYNINQSKPNTYKLAVKGSVQSQSKSPITVVVKIDVFRKSDNTKAATMSSTVENIAPGATANFVAAPAMIVPSGTNANTTYYYKLNSYTER